MRLIDKDALPSALFQKHVHDEEELEPMLYFEDAVKVVENAPTIDAIPVEWLEHKRDEAYKTVYYCGGNVKRNAEIMSAIRTVLELWQKEQEVR